MSGKPKTIPSLSHQKKSMSDPGQMPYDQNRAHRSTQSHETHMTAGGASEKKVGDAPTDENLVNDDVIEQNSHVIPPLKKHGDPILDTASEEDTTKKE